MDFTLDIINSNFKRLNSSLNIKTQLSKVSIRVSMSRLKSWISNLCLNHETGSAKQKLLENANPPVWQNGRNFWANVEISFPVKCGISLIVLGFYILWLVAPCLTLLVCWHHYIFGKGLSLTYRTAILKVLIPVLILRL